MLAGTVLSAETLTLEACIDMARSNNPTIRQKELSAEIARSQVKQSYSAIMPGISVSSGVGSSSQTSWDLNTSVGLSAGLTLYTPGLYSGIRSAQMNKSANQALYAGAANEIVNQVRSLYYNILSTRKLIGVYEENITVAEENLRKTRAMYAMRVITESDVLKSEAQKGEFESQLLLQKQLYVSYLRNLSVLLGRESGDEFDVVDIDVEQVLIPPYEASRKAMLEQNPDLAAAQLQEEIGKVRVKASKEAYLPSVSGSYTYSDGFDPADTPVNSVGLNASWTLFNGLSRRENVQQQKLQLEQTRIGVDNTVRMLEQQLQNYYTQFETYTAMIDISERRLVSARRDFEIVNQQYELGKVTILERMQAHLSVLSAESSLVEAQYSRKIVESGILALINNL
ncbi:MAG: TolC family protein [Candidatus Marinimicrobia bacterium]|nr:TolC family protein [Candidatus Neomarinimicrobiota bacterium]